MRSYRRFCRSCAVLTMSDPMLLLVLYYNMFVYIATYDEGHCNGKRAEAEGSKRYAMHVSEMT